MYSDPDRIRPARGRGPQFGLAFVSALEQVLDPVVALLDCCSEHFVPEIAPPGLVDLMAAWLGLELDESWSEDRRRVLVRHGPELARWRGTQGGLKMALELIYPDLPLRVVDRGGVVWAGEAEDTGRSREFVVYCDAPLPETEQAAIVRVIDQLKPAGVRYKLRVKRAPPAASDEEAL
jgi:phage tail-like protein